MLSFLSKFAILSSLLVTFVNCHGYYYESRQRYRLADSFIGDDFFDQFDFFTDDDPTHGRVNYLSKEQAMYKKLAYVRDGAFFMLADSENVVPLGTRGRDSVRIISKEAYADSVVVLDLAHMPEGCATWPAFWTLSKLGPWPAGGEVDIIEGVNLNRRNLATLHTTPGCTMPEYGRFMSGSAVSTNCDVNVNFNQGCVVNFTNPVSYGSPFNQHRGGWYVMERNAAKGVSIWFWPRYDVTVPNEISQGFHSVKPDIFRWGFPQALFPFSDTCDSSNHFDPHQIIFDDTFCGDFAGALYPTSGCPGVCEDFVSGNPEAFVNAFWEINSLRVYTPSYD